MKRVTGLGIKWEWMHSGWMIFLFTPFTLPISYFYVGIRMHQIRWVFTGFVYVFLLHGLTYFLWKWENRAEDAVVILVIGMVLIYLNGIGRGSLVRKDYLPFLAEHMDPDKRRELEEKEEKRLHTDYLNKVAQQSNVITKTQAFKRQSAKVKFTVTEQEKNRRVKVININKANMTEIKHLPTVGYLLASKIVQTREDVGSFASFQELAYKTGIQAHLITEAKDYMAFTDEDVKPLQVKLAKKKQKQLRKEKNIPGRSVDF